MRQDNDRIMDKVAFKKSFPRQQGRTQTGSDRGRKSDGPKPVASSDILATVKRREMFRRYIADASLNTDQLATRLMLSPSRIDELISGRSPISNELATHIEEMLQLPASWLDQGGPLIIGELPMPHPVEDTAAASADAQDPIHVQASDRKQVMENRRLNLIMLTSERGTKNRLAQLAGTSGSRISLMTSARKPVSDPFAYAIEDGLGFARGWLDQIHSEQDVPAPVWQSLRNDVAATPEAATSAEPTRSSAPRSVPRAPRMQAAPAAVASVLAESATTASATAAADSAPRQTPASAVSATGLFDKTPGRCGPIAEALAKTVLNLSAADKLSEAKAFQLLGVLVTETERTG